MKTSFLPIPADSESLRRTWSRRRKKALTEIRTVRERLDAFERDGAEMYQSWLGRTFPSLLTRISEIRSAGAELEGVLHAIDFEARWAKKKKYEAYREVFARKAEGLALISDEARAKERAAIEADRRAFDEMRAKVEAGSARPEDFAELRENFRDFLSSEIGPSAFFISDEDLDEMMRERMGMDSERARAAGFGAENFAEESEDLAASPGIANDRKPLRTLYRELARRLHPDVNGEKFGEADRRLWHEVQTAYAAGDVERLSALRAYVDENGGGISEREVFETIADLMDAVAGLQATLKDLRSTERRLRKTPVFTYFKQRTSKTKLARFAEITERGLWCEVENAGDHLEAMERVLEKYAKAPAKRRARPPTLKGPLTGL